MGTGLGPLVETMDADVCDEFVEVDDFAQSDDPEFLRPFDFLDSLNFQDAGVGSGAGPAATWAKEPGPLTAGWATCEGAAFLFHTASFLVNDV